MASAFLFKLDYHDPLETFGCLQHEPYSLLFDSADTAHQSGRYSFIAYHPFETVECWNGAVLVTNKEEQLSRKENAFRVLAERMQKWGVGIPYKENLPPFPCGAAGFFGYDLARSLEKLPAKALANPDMPEMAVGLYDKVIAFDHREKKAFFMALADNEKEARLKFNHLKNIRLRQPEQPRGTDKPVQWRSGFTQDTYRKAVQKVIDFIRAGDIFQANIAQRFEAVLPDGFSPFAHYKNLRRVNPAPFAAYMNFGSLILASASPERFLQVRGRQVETRPIKGTRPRRDGAYDDKAMRDELAASEKDRAENIMIVDLLRNDLSKVCEDESVQAPQICAVESFARVHHLVSTVTGKLHADKTPLDLLEACFPGGSITGAPKVRAMEIIETIEPVRRGPYCGAMGYIGFNGAMDMNIAIRTLVFDGGKASFHAGGGITAESDPAAEYQETLDKAEAIFGSFSHNQKAGKTSRQ